MGIVIIGIFGDQEFEEYCFNFVLDIYIHLFIIH